MKNKIIANLGVLSASALFSGAALASTAVDVVEEAGHIGGCIFGFCFFIIW